MAVGADPAAAALRFVRIEYVGSVTATQIAFYLVDNPVKLLRVLILVIRIQDDLCGYDQHPLHISVLIDLHSRPFVSNQ